MSEAPTSPSSRLRVRVRSAVWSLAIAIVLVAGPEVGATLAADPSPTADPTATATLGPTPTPSPVLVLSLLRSGDFVRQYTNYQCVGASLQIMRNMIWSWNSRAASTQRRLWRRARARSLYTADGGADPFGWAAATATSGHGRYVLVATDSMQATLRLAARSMALTHRPVGIVVWRGAHAWVLTGVDTTADPATTTDFQVVAGRIADPLYPKYRVWHRTIYRPGTRLSLSVLASNFSPYHDSRRDPRIEGKWVAIIPLRDTDPLPAAAVVRATIPSPTPAPSPAASPTASPSPVASAAPAPAAASSAGPTATPSPMPTIAPTPAPTPDPAPTTSPAPSPTG